MPLPLGAASTAGSTTATTVVSAPTTGNALFDAFSSNPYFSAGFGLIGVTASLALFRQAAIHGVTFARRRLLVTLEIPSKDTSYNWFLQWMGAQARSRGTNPHQLAVETSFVRRENGSSETSFQLVPGPGKHYFKYAGAWFQVERQRERQMIDLKSGTPWETITLTTLSRDRKLFNQMLDEAKQFSLSKEEGKMVIYTSWGVDWRPFGNPRRRRPIESVVLGEGVAKGILEDVRRFLEGGKWYYDRGIPYRRGYLLHGPPGSGKTSFIQALAGELEYNICVLNLSERGMTDDRLSHLLSHAPPRSIVLLEDIDAAFSNRQQTEKQGYQSQLTFSGLLNALDGVGSSEERIIFMTTNHLPRLDPALIRPGRVDYQVLIDNATEQQARTMFLRFYGGEDGLAEEFVRGLRGVLRREGEVVGEGEKGVSPAMLQGHFVMYREDAEGAVRDLGRLLVQ
ncbi:hypothetical protein HDV00_002732 [Rhizophlyctis rosea]|nr:hypothetical protein HDV00_002732 [Rhizophlyctis rosea]